MDNVELLRDPNAYEDARFVTLVEDIEAIGIEESLKAIELSEGQEVRIASGNSSFFARGPCVLFIGALPMEAFEEE